MEHGWLNPVRRTPSLANPRLRATSLPPYSRQTTPTSVHHALLQVDLQEDDAFHHDEAIRAFPFYRLTDAQKEVYRLLSATDTSDWTALGKAWHTIEADESAQVSLVAKASAPPLANSFSPKRTPANGTDGDLAAADFKEISLDDRPLNAASPNIQQDPAKVSCSFRLSLLSSHSFLFFQQAFGMAYRAWEEEVQLWAKMQKEKIQRFEAIDWIRSGLLAWRLCKPLEAQSLLEEAAKSSTSLASTAAWKELIEMFARSSGCCCS